MTIRIGHYLAVALCLPFAACAQGRPSSPPLVVQITVDQLRADLIHRFSEGFTEGGFNRLMNNGVWYIDAQHRHANTETVVGHTTLSTGTDPSVHGMVANNYRDNRLLEVGGGGQSAALDVSNAFHYATRDDDYPLLNPDGSHSDPKDGRSPRDILSTTVGDEFRLSFGQEAKIFGVSSKDRAAIGATGHAGTAFWYSDKFSTYITSTFYLDSYPQWVKDWTDRKLVEGYANTSWSLMLDPALYTFRDFDDQEWEKDYANWTRVFDHDYGKTDFPLYQGFIATSPAADHLTLSFARAMIEGEGIGADAIPDYLAISLNSVDYVGHAFGPSSLEAEDNLKRLDKELAEFFDWLDERIGLDNVLVVLSADHGATEVPGFTNTRMRTNVNLFDYSKVEEQPAIAQLLKDHDITTPLSQYSSPYVYFDNHEIAKAGLDKAKVTKLYADVISSMDGIAYAFSHERIATGALPNDRIGRAVTANFNPSRAGDLYLVFQPGWFYMDPSPQAGASQHGSPYMYDRHVPVFFMGPGVEPQVVSRQIETIDVAPTIAAYMKIKFPSGSRGRLLGEVLGDYQGGLRP